MKKLLLVTLTLIISQSTFAVHAYRSETCTSKTHILKYKGNYPLGGAYGLSKIDSESEVEIWDTNDSESEYSGADNQFKAIGAEITSSKTVKADCGPNNDGFDFEETQTSSVFKMEFSKLSTSDEQKTGIKSGTEMYFRCEETFSMPVSCEK